MTVFEKVTASPEALGELLDSLTAIDSPWEQEFHKVFCAGCDQGDCTACPHEKERNNPTWWLTGTTEDEREVPLDKLPEPLREIKQNHPAVKIYKTSPVSHGLKGNLHYMEVGAAMMFELGKLLWAGEGRYRVTIECDPETGKFEAKREDIEKETAPASETEGRQDVATLSAENRQRQEYLNLARQFHLPISAAIEHYIRAFDRMLAERVRKGRTAGSWGDGTTTGEDIFHWWMEDGVLPGQIDMEDLLEETEDEE